MWLITIHPRFGQFKAYRWGIGSTKMLNDLLRTTDHTRSIIAVPFRSVLS